ncbi:polycystin-1-like protein 2 [Aulostomus maculatus]
MDVTVSCPENQVTFRNSCYQFVALNLSFSSAQDWCDQNGGHLAFVTDHDTQCFLERHLNPEEDVWLGLAPPVSPDLPHTATVEGPLSWLDGSDVTFSNWVSRPQPGDTCAHFRKKSGFRWKATRDCRQKMHFTCQFAHCQGRQVCHVGGFVDSLEERCPLPGGYLSVPYRCGDGVLLSVSSVAAVFNDVTINVKWLLDLPTGNLRCKLSAGDNHAVHLHSPQRLEHSVVHRYTHPSAFVVTAECIVRDVHIKAEKIITIQEPVTELGVIGCYAANLSFQATNCTAVYGRAFHIQTKVKAGSHVTFTLQRDELLLSSVTVMRGNVARNVTVSPEKVHKLGPGCHQVTLYASNVVTFPAVTQEFQVCVFEEVSGLQASVQVNRLGSPDLSVAVALERGEPVLLLLSVTTGNSSSTEIRQMDTRKEIFHFECPIQGSLQVRLRAWNFISSSEVEVEMLDDSDLDSVAKLYGPNDSSLRRPAETRSCYRESGKRPLVEKQDGGTKYTVTRSTLTQAKLKGQKVTVVITSEEALLLQRNTAKRTVALQLAVVVQRNTVERTVALWLAVVVQRNTAERTVLPWMAVVVQRNTAERTVALRLAVVVQRNTAERTVALRLAVVVQRNTAERTVALRLAVVVQRNTAERTVALRLAVVVQRNTAERTVALRLAVVVQRNTAERTVALRLAVVVQRNTAERTVLPWLAVVVQRNTAERTVALRLAVVVQRNTAERTVALRLAVVVQRNTAERTVALRLAVVVQRNTAERTVALRLAVVVQRNTAERTVLPWMAVVVQRNTAERTVALRLAVLVQRNTAERTVALRLAVVVQRNTAERTVALRLAVVVQRNTAERTVLPWMAVVVQRNTAERTQTVQLALPTNEKHLRCSKNNEVNLVFLPLGERQSNYSLIITAFAKNGSYEVNTTMTVQVLDFTEESGSSDNRLQATIKDAVAQLKKQGLLSGETVGQLFNSVSSKLNGQTDASNKDERQKLREQMLDVMIAAVKEAPSNSPEEVQATARGFTAVIQKGAELSRSAQEEAALLLVNVCLSLLHMSVNSSEEHKKQVHIAASNIVAGASNVLNYSTSSLLTCSIGPQVLFLRPVGEQVNTSVLNLRNYSTTAIDVPSADTTLLLQMVPSEDPLPLKLFLGYMDYPTETNYVTMTEMPHQGTTQKERYTWLIDPESLKGNIGLHYLVVRPKVGPGVKFINATLSITSIAAACKFWDESVLDWSDYGCRVGLQSTHLVTQCLCNHLTFFGSSFFVTPNLVDPSRTAELFGTFVDNPVVVCFLGALFIVYLIVVVWARRKDIQDTAKVKVSVLEDNNTMDEYCYLLVVKTGLRLGASTSSQVTITLLGTEGNSEPHHLADPEKSLFERGAVDAFLLATPFPLGELQGIRLWHNNSGRHPAWYVSNVMVQDLQTSQKWHCLCSSWLGVDMCDCSLDKVFLVSTETDLKRFSNLFFMKTTKDFSDGHLWYSVMSRPPSSSFTCVQRVSCCFSLLLCTMLTSIMFYGIPTDPSEQTMDLGHFEFTWQQFMIGVQSSLMMFPVNILIVGVFRNTRPRETARRKPDELQQEAVTGAVNTVTLDSVVRDITRIANLLTKTVKSNIPCSESTFGPEQVDITSVLCVVEDFIRRNATTLDFVQLQEISDGVHPGMRVGGIQMKSSKAQYLYRQLCHIDKELSLLGPSSFPSSHSYSQAQQQVQGMKGFLEDQLFTPSSKNLDGLAQKSLSPPESGDGDAKKRVRCHALLPWWFIFVGWLLVIVTSSVAGYFTMLYGLKFGKERSVSWLVSMIISFSQSFLVIQPLKLQVTEMFAPSAAHSVRRDGSVYQPLPPADVEELRRNKMKEQRAFALLREILTYVGFMWMLLVGVYGQRDQNGFLLNQHIRDSFRGKVSHSMSLGEVFTWANTSLLTNLFGVYPGFITDGNSKLVGHARLRQVRVRKNSCQLSGSVLHLVPDCHAPYSWELEDMDSYGPGWNFSEKNNISASTSSHWKYQTQAQLRSHHVRGRTALYRGGGFVAELGPDLQSASSTLHSLFRNKWLDVYTRAIFVEFTIYNANVNLFCVVTLLLETTAVGAFQFQSELRTVRLYQSTGALRISVMAAEIIYLLFIVYYMSLQGKLMMQQRWAYFRSKWNLLELTIIVLSWSAVGVFIKRTLQGERDVTFYQNNKNQFANFYETATADSSLQYLMAFLVLLASIKLWHVLRLNPTMNLITVALLRAWSDITGFLVILVVMLVAFSTVCYLIYGWELSSYRTLPDALLTIISLQMGTFNYDEVLSRAPILGALVFGSCIGFMSFVVLNLFISVVLVAFNQEQIHHTASEEEEIVQLLLKKIYSLFGIGCKVSGDVQLPPDGDGSGGGGGLTLSHSPNILQSSHDAGL